MNFNYTDILPILLSNSALTELSTPPDIAHTTCLTTPMIFILICAQKHLIRQVKKNKETFHASAMKVAIIKVLFKILTDRKQKSSTNESMVPGIALTGTP